MAKIKSGENFSRNLKADAQTIPYHIFFIILHLPTKGEQKSKKIKINHDIEKKIDLIINVYSTLYSIIINEVITKQILIPICARTIHTRLYFSIE